MSTKEMLLMEFFKAIGRMRWSVILLTYGLLASMIVLFLMGFKEAAIYVAAVTGVVGVIGIIAAPETPAQMPASTGEKMLELMMRIVELFKNNCNCGARNLVISSWESQELTDAPAREENQKAGRYDQD